MAQVQHTPTLLTGQKTVAVRGYVGDIEKTQVSKSYTVAVPSISHTLTGGQEEFTITISASNEISSDKWQYKIGTGSWEAGGAIGTTTKTVTGQDEGTLSVNAANAKHFRWSATYSNCKNVVIESAYPDFTFVATGFNDDSTHTEDWVGYATGYTSSDGSSTRMSPSYVSPRETTGHTHSGVKHSHDYWAVGSLAMNKDGTIFIGGSHSKPKSATNSDALYRGYHQSYKFNGTQWVTHGTRKYQWQQEDGIQNNHHVRSYYGRSVAMNGDGTIMAVGMYQWQSTSALEDQGDATVYIWSDSSNDWVFRQKQTLFHAEKDAHNGRCLAFDETGDKLFHVAGRDDRQPKLERYDWNGTKYELAHSFSTTNMNNSEEEGASVFATLDANHVIFWCGSIVRVYKWNGSGYSTKGTDLSITNSFKETDFVARYLTNVKISQDGDFVAFTSNASVVSYDWNGSSWVARPTISVTGQKYFGCGLDIASKNVLVVGNPQGVLVQDSGGATTGDNDTAKGEVRIYIYEDGSWTLNETLLGRNETGAKYGNTVVCSRE